MKPINTKTIPLSFSNISIVSIFTMIVAVAILMLLGMDLAFADQLDTVFTDINAKTGTIETWIKEKFVYIIAFLAFVAWVIGMVLKKLSWSEGIIILIGILLLGFASPLVKGLLGISAQ